MSRTKGSASLTMSGDTVIARGTNDSLCIVIVGDSLVGKTSFLRRIQDETNEAAQIPPVTVGTNLFDLSYSIDGEELRLEMWDTAGQERYRSIVPMYYRRADAVMVLFDITNRVSFLHAREWVSEARRYGQHICKIILVGNKTDLLAPRRMERATSETEVQRFVTTYDLLYAEMSVRQNINVWLTLEKIVRETFKVRNERRTSQMVSSVVKIDPSESGRRLCCR